MNKKITLLIVLQCLLFNLITAQNLVPYCKNGIYGYSDLKGKIKIEPQYTRATPFVNSAAIVSISGEYFLIDSKGNKINAKAFDDIDLMESGVYRAAKGDCCGIINKEGTVLLPFIYKDIEMDGPGYIARSHDEKEIYVSIDYKEVLRADKDIKIDGYDHDTLFTLSYINGVNEVETKMSVIIDRRGKIIYGPVKGTAYARQLKPFNCFMINLQIDTIELNGVIEKNGGIIVPVEYKEVEEMEMSRTLEKKILLLIKKAKDPYSILTDKTLLAGLFITARTEDKIAVYNMLGEQIVKPTRGQKAGLLELQKTSLIMVASKTEDKEGNTIAEVWLYTQKGKLINKQALNEIDDDDDAIEKNLIIGTMDSLMGVYDADGNEYIPFKYKKIEAGYNGTLTIYNHKEKQKLTVYPNDPKLSDEKTWYDEIYQDGPIVINVKDSIKYFGLLDSIGKQVLPVEYEEIKLIGKDALVKDFRGKRFIYCPNGDRVELPDNMIPGYIINSKQKQFIVKDPNAIVVYNNGTKETVCTFNTGDYIDDLSTWKKGNDIYMILGRNDSVAIYKISGTKIKQLHAFGPNSYATDSPFGISYAGKDSTFNFVTLTGEEAVPFGKWEYMNDFNTWGKQFKGKNLVIAKSKQKTIAYNEKGKKIYECKDCYIEINECDWDYNQNTIMCGFDKDNDKNYFLTYDIETNKPTSIPLRSNSEELNDTTWVLKDTTGASYLYFIHQQKLVPLKIKHNSFFTFGENELSYGFTDIKNNWYILDNKTLALIKVPGTSSDVEPFYSTYNEGNIHSYLYCNIEKNGEKKQGVVTEKGKILIEPEYESIEVPVEFQDYPVFLGKRQELTDIINIKGEIVNPVGKKYTNVYSESENLLTAETMKGDTLYVDLYNPFNNYKKINYTFKSISYPEIKMINGKYVVQYSQNMIKTITEEGQTYEDLNEYDLYIGEDGTKYFEFDKQFKIE